MQLQLQFNDYQKVKKEIKEGDILNLKTGKHKLKEIFYINMAVDRFDFYDRESFFAVN